MASQTEENYIKAIYKVAERENKAVSTNAISQAMQTTAASVTDMLKRLAASGLINYEKYRGVTLTEKGRNLATQLIRKHRLWETFLYDKLGFQWDEVHEIAEQLEHIRSEELVRRLDDHLGNPKFDPHGDPIPNEDGKFTLRKQAVLQEQKPGTRVVVVGVREHSNTFLQHLSTLGIGIDTELNVLDLRDYDHSMRLAIGDDEVMVSAQVARNIYVRQFAT
jgi:DtxR family Mn-dependent transcriptional regulator